MRPIPVDRDRSDFDLMQRLLLTKTAPRPSLARRLFQAALCAMGLRKH